MLPVRLARESLIQFGRFVQADGAEWPVALRLGWLPSYPALLRDVAAALDPLVAASGADRVLTTDTAIPLGVALALVADRVVLYPAAHPAEAGAAFAIEGAYDVGHPTVLLSDTLLDGAQAEAIRALASRVGLEIHAVFAVVDLGLGAREALEAAGFSVAAVFTLREALPLLEDVGVLPPPMRVSVEAWLAEISLA
jgi:orotate phosphoribosyltransferase